MKRFIVYFFGTDFDRVKIGISESNLYRRQMDIQTGCPDPIKLLGIIQCKNRAEMRHYETELQAQFQGYNTIGEWFRLVPEISAYIEEFTESGKDIMSEDYQHYYERKRESRDRESDQEYQREYYQRNLKNRDRESDREYQREYRQRPEYGKKNNERQREYYQRNCEKMRKYNRERYHARKRDSQTN